MHICVVSGKARSSHQSTNQHARSAGHILKADARTGRGQEDYRCEGFAPFGNGDQGFWVDEMLLLGKLF